MPASPARVHDTMAAKQANSSLLCPLHPQCRGRLAPGAQVMLRQDNGQYACIAEDARRYNLGAAKEELMAAMGLDTEAEGSAMQFLRRGYKVRICCF